MDIVTIIRKSNNSEMTKFACDALTITKDGDKYRLWVPDEVEKKLRIRSYTTFATKSFYIQKDVVIPKIKKSYLIIGIVNNSFAVAILDYDKTIKKISMIDILVNNEKINPSDLDI